jgi:hypothetical protein
MIVMVWFNDDTHSAGAVAAARERFVPGDEVVLLHVTAAGLESCRVRREAERRSPCEAAVARWA